MKRYFKRIILTVLVLLIAAFVMKNFFPAEWSFIVPHKHGDFVRVGNMHNAMSGVLPVLLDDGRVFISRGNTTEIYNPKTRRFKEIKKDNFKKNSLPVPVKLKDGRVILIGGSNEHGNTWPDTYIFDPKTNRFEKGPDMIQGRIDHSAVLLDDGRVFVAGGRYTEYEKSRKGITYNPYLKSTEFYNPKTNRFEKGPDLPINRNSHNAILLNNNSVLILGGFSDANKETMEHPLNVEMYNPKTNKISIVGKLSVDRYGTKIIKLKSDDIYIYEGFKDYTGISKNPKIVEYYNPKTGLSKVINKRTTAQDFINLALLPNDTILFAGGISGFGLSYKEYDNAQIYNPKNNEFIELEAKLPVIIGGNKGITLKDGNLLMIGSEENGSGKYAVIYMFNNKIER